MTPPRTTLRPRRASLLLWSASLLLPLWAAACSAAPLAPQAPGAIAAREGCEGSIQIPDGARVLDGETAPLGAVGKGYLCDARVFEAQKPLTLYRVYNSTEASGDGKAHRIGGSWSLTRPAGKAEDYRAQNAICPSWNDLGKLVVCTLKPGARFYAGPGQSVSAETCGTPGAPSFKASATNQVLLPFDKEAKKYPIAEADCRDEVLAWER